MRTQREKASLRLFRKTPAADIASLHCAEELASEAVVALFFFKPLDKQLYMLPLRMLIGWAATFYYREALVPGNAGDFVLVTVNKRADYGNLLS